MSREHEETYGRYSMVIEWEPQGGVFVVSVPELPGCQTHGHTYEEAIAQGQEVIAGWIEAMRDWGRPIPPPRVFDLGPVEEPVAAGSGAVGR